ncbi:acylneuraminate cytidylyltransferase family protein [Gammaproteobacteria bacterium]|nr:acylneuraminate cytidylyltransferase family protein [Gammaproteobacteria bacterium]
MNNICTICARGGSKGVPNKNIKLLNGIPLITYTIQQAIQSKLFSKVVVSTDSQKIANVALAAGAECWFLRPKYLSLDKASKLDAIRHAVSKAESKFNTSYDFVFDLDATSPLRKVSDIKKAFKCFLGSKASNLITATPARKNPYFNMIEYSGTEIKLVKSIKGSCSPQSRQVAPPVYDMNASIYIWKRDSLFNDSSLINKYTVLHEMPEDRSIDIDTMIDWHLVELLMKLNLKK